MEQYAAHVDPNDLLIFARVAELGSFSRAAERLGLPKSTVSRRLSALEGHVGERLLLRTTRRQTITEFGHQLLAHARQVLAEVHAVSALRERRHAAPSGHLRVSMPSGLANVVLSRVLTDFVARYPAVSLDLDLSTRRVDLLGDGYDLAVRMGPLPDDGLLAARRLAVLPAGLFAAPRYLADRGAPASPDALAAHDGVRLGGGRGEVVIWSLHQGEQRWQGELPGRAVANSPDLLVRMACAGAGIVAVPDCFAEEALQAGHLQRVLPDWRLPDKTAWAVFPGRQLMPAKTRVFIDALIAAFGGEPAA